MARSRRSSTRTVVLIEDDEFLAAALRDLLQFNDYHVIVASTLRAVENALAQSSDRVVVLLDPMTRGISPAGVLRVIGEGRTLITIAVAVSASSGGRVPDNDLRRQRRPLSTDLLLEMIADAFAADVGNEAMRLPRAA